MHIQPQIHTLNCQAIHYGTIRREYRDKFDKAPESVGGEANH